MSAGRQDQNYFGGGGGMTGGQGVQGQTNYQIEGRAEGQQKPQGYRFSSDEIRAIKECNRESFFYRCLPLGTLMGCGAWYAVKQGYLKPSARFGAGPKMFAAGVVGYFIGKISYQKKCAEKLMAIPNSQLGEALRKRKGQMGFQESLTLEPSFSTVATPVGVPAFPNSELSQAYGYSDVGDTRPMMGFDSEGSSNISGYDKQSSSNSYSYDTTQQMLDDGNLPPKSPQSFTSYDDLRRQNRIEYETKQHSRSAPAPAPQSLPDTRQSGPQGGGYGYDGFQSTRGSSYPTNDNKPRNKYGDVWDDKPSNY